MIFKSILLLEIVLLIHVNAQLKNLYSERVPINTSLEARYSEPDSMYLLLHWEDPVQYLDRKQWTFVEFPHFNGAPGFYYVESSSTRNGGVIVQKDLHGEGPYYLWSLENNIFHIKDYGQSSQIRLGGSGMVLDSFRDISYDNGFTFRRVDAKGKSIRFTGAEQIPFCPCITDHDRYTKLCFTVKEGIDSLIQTPMPSTDFVGAKFRDDSLFWRIKYDKKNTKLYCGAIGTKISRRIDTILTVDGEALSLDPIYVTTTRDSNIIYVDRKGWFAKKDQNGWHKLPQTVKPFSATDDLDAYQKRLTWHQYKSILPVRKINHGRRSLFSFFDYGVVHFDPDDLTTLGEDTIPSMGGGEHPAIFNLGSLGYSFRTSKLHATRFYSLPAPFATSWLLRETEKYKLTRQTAVWQSKAGTLTLNVNDQMLRHDSNHVPWFITAYESRVSVSEPVVVTPTEDGTPQYSWANQYPFINLPAPFITDSEVIFAGTYTRRFTIDGKLIDTLDKAPSTWVNRLNNGSWFIGENAVIRIKNVDDSTDTISLRNSFASSRDSVGFVSGMIENGDGSWTVSVAGWKIIDGESGEIKPYRKGGILRSTDKGRTWTESKLADTASQYILSLSRTKNGSLLAQSLHAEMDTANRREGQFPALKCYGIKIWRSTDDGITWSLRHEIPYSAEWDFCTGNITYCKANRLFMATMGGLILSNDDGRNWRLHPFGNSTVTVVHINTSREGNLLAATTEGVFEEELDNVSVQEERDLIPSQVYTREEFAKHLYSIELSYSGRVASQILLSDIKGTSIAVASNSTDKLSLGVYLMTTIHASGRIFRERILLIE